MKATVTTYQEAASYLAAGRNPTYRKIANNTYVERWTEDGETRYGVRLYATVVVTYLPDGSQILNTGGWCTHTTANRMHAHIIARVGSVDGQWFVYHSSDPLTAPRIQKCRKCHGAGEILNQHHCYGANVWAGDKVCQHGKQLGHDLPATLDKCSQCRGEGTYNYGSNPIPTPFYDGIKVDSTGKVVA